VAYFKILSHFSLGRNEEATQTLVKIADTGEKIKPWTSQNQAGVLI